MCWPVLTPRSICKFSSQSEKPIDRSPQKTDAVLQNPFLEGDTANCLILPSIDLNPITFTDISQGVTITVLKVGSPEHQHHSIT